MKTTKAVLCSLCVLLTIIISAKDLIVAPPTVDSVRKFDEYRGIPIGDEKARLDNFYHELRRDPNTIGYIIVYAGRRARLGIAKTRAVRAK
ncbi:MAG: hypothetical protein M3R15_21500 [Acidobacteriota bacterium]|nr:hypothetical protein [Acidobacteriota bacterium]